LSGCFDFCQALWSSHTLLADMIEARFGGKTADHAVGRVCTIWTHETLLYHPSAPAYEYSRVASRVGETRLACSSRSTLRARAFRHNPCSIERPGRGSVLRERDLEHAMVETGGKGCRL
jgi:hypothetical protein